MIDDAQQLEEAERAEGVRAVSAALLGPGSEDCAECGDKIPEARRRAFPAATRCIGCQEQSEWSRRLASPPHSEPVTILGGKRV
jgi:phage/conjugal plasmid C-4 type zinc finger TraR family protein